MGCCCSCLRRGGSSGSETEMAPKGSGGGVGGEGGGVGGSRSLNMSRSMTSPTVQLEKGNKVYGTGLALAGVSVEQDAAYWEWHIAISETIRRKAEENAVESTDNDGSDAVKFGVSTRKDAKFYRALNASGDGEDATPVEDGTALMKPIPNLNDGDTVGVAVQHSDLPMVQFLLNGEPLHELAINRFRGAVFPAIYVQEGVTATAVFDEDDFKEMSPHARFGPLIVARGII